MFEDFCGRLATVGHIEISDDETIPEDKKVSFESLCSIIEPKIGILNRIRIRFIESLFEETDYISRLRAIDDIPDGILNGLSRNLYDKSFNSLSDKEQSIIKVLGCYLMIQS